MPIDQEFLKALIWSFQWASIAVHSQSEGPNETQLKSLAKVESLIEHEQEIARKTCS